MGRLLLAALLASISVFANSESQWVSNSQAGHFTIELQPPKSISIGAFQHWHIVVTDNQGQAVYPVKVHIAGGMEDHGHGLPTAPKVTRYLGDGRYLIEGVQFTMAGQWLWQLLVENETARDSAEFRFQLEW